MSARAMTNGNSSAKSGQTAPMAKGTPVRVQGQHLLQERRRRRELERGGEVRPQLLRREGWVGQSSCDADGEGNSSTRAGPGAGPEIPIPLENSSARSVIAAAQRRWRRELEREGWLAEAPATSTAKGTRARPGPTAARAKPMAKGT